MRWLLALLLTATLAHADGERPGDFDYYVLSLSWSPTWCALEGERRNSPQCDRQLGWVMHGLWPQNEKGWPSYCKSSAIPPSRSETAAMADIMGTAGAAWYQWKKHGACSGLPSEEYFDLARRAYDAVVRPEVFRKLDAPVRLPAEVVEEAFIKENPELDDDEVVVTCKAKRIQEIRICLTKDLEPRDCSRDIARDCSMKNALLDNID